jgi:hypothetical protein
MKQQQRRLVAGPDYPVPDPASFNVDEALLRMQALVSASNENNTQQQSRNPPQHAVSPDYAQ